MRINAVTLFLLFVTLVGCQSSIGGDANEYPTPANGSNVERKEENNLQVSPEMESAINEARNTLPEFWQAWKDNGFGIGDYIVNVKIMNEEGTRGEFLWMAVEAFGDNEVTGIIETVPTLGQELKPGDRVTVSESDVVDWIFIPEDGDHKGGYTLKALGTSKEDK